jgi:predicted acetyltransferase
MDGDGGLFESDEYVRWLADMRADKHPDTVREGRVPATQYIGVRTNDNRVVGMLQIRHTLNEYLLRLGGHIGYSVRPSERRRGYAKQMLALALDHCRLLGLDKVLITCDKNNPASAKTILANGGVLENEIDEGNRITQRYWIAL